MKLLYTILPFILTLLLSSCGNDGLGMKIKITEIAAPSLIPEGVTEAKAGKLNISVNGNQALTDALAVAFNTKKPPTGDLIFTKLIVRNRSMEHPSRASAEIDAICIWTEAGGSSIGFDVTVRTYSISLEEQSQLKYLRDEALTGMVAKLVKKL